MIQLQCHCDRPQTAVHLIRVAKGVDVITDRWLTDSKFLSRFADILFFDNRIIDKIIELNVKQQTIHNLSIRLKQIITKLPSSTQPVLHSYYRNYGTTPNIPVQAARLKMAERTFYRHLDHATEFVGNHLTVIGINFFTWQDLLHQHP